MNIPKAYIGGFQKAVKSPRMVFILYFSNLVLALILALPFMNFLQNSFDNSLLFENLLDGFDYTSFNNLTFYKESGLSAILGSVKWLFIAYFLLNIFLTGGIIRTLNKERFTTANFFSGAAYNFFRFLGTSTLIIILQVIVAAIIYIPLGLIFDSLDAVLANELKYYYWGIGAFTLHILLFLLVSMIGDYAKFHLVLNDSFNIFKAVWKGIKYTFTHFAKTYFLYLFLLILPAVVMYIYLYYESDMKMATGVGILIVFAMQQGFILLRVFLRVWILASQFKVYSSDFIKSSQIQDLVFGGAIHDDDDIIENKEEIVEEKNTKPETKKDSAYQIDFSSTFKSGSKASDNEQILTEEEMLQKLQSEEPEDEPLEEVSEQTKAEVKSIAKEKEEVYDEEIYKENNKEIESFNEDDTIEEAETEEELELEKKDFIEPELIHINVTNGLAETPIVEDEEEDEEETSEKSKSKVKSENDEDIIEFEL